MPVSHTPDFKESKTLAHNILHIDEFKEFEGLVSGPQGWEAGCP